MNSLDNFAFYNIFGIFKYRSKFIIIKCLWMGENMKILFIGNGFDLD